MNDEKFEIGFSFDFLNEDGKQIFPNIGLSLLEKEPGSEYRFLRTACNEYAPESLRELDVLITLKPRVTAESLQGVERLCGIGRCGVGYDNIDLKACTEKDIAVYITPAGVVKSMASSIVLMVLALSHRLVVKDRMVREGLWLESQRELGREPRNRAVGSIGMGNIAREVVRLLKGFGVMDFLAFDPYTSEHDAAELGVKKVSLDELLLQSDYVLVSCPLTRETRHLMGQREFSLMKETAFLVNAARGPIVDEAALTETLQQRRIAGAALDVFEEEPLSRSSPLLKLDNVILTSHSLGWTEELFRDMGRIDCEGALALMRGESPPNVVNREVLERPGFREKLRKNARRFAMENTYSSSA